MCGPYSLPPREKQRPALRLLSLLVPGLHVINLRLAFALAPALKALRRRFLGYLGPARGGLFPVE